MAAFSLPALSRSAAVGGAAGETWAAAAGCGAPGCGRVNRFAKAKERVALATKIDKPSAATTAMVAQKVRMANQGPDSFSTKPPSDQQSQADCDLSAMNKQYECHSGKLKHHAQG